MRTIFLISILVALCGTAVSQDTTLIKVIKKGEVLREKTSRIRAEQEKPQMLFGFLPWWQMEAGVGSTSGFSFNGDIEPYAGTEYSLSEKETAHYYNLGLDVGTDALMIGIGVKLPNHSPVGDKHRTLFSSRIYKKFSFKGYSAKRLSVYGAPKANFQFGTEYNFGSVNISPSESEEITKQKFRYISPFIGLLHPVFEKSYLGIKTLRNIEVINKESYTSLLIQFSFRFD